MGDALNPRARTLQVVVSIVSLGLAGCNELALRKGPPAVLDGTAVRTAADNRIAITNALALDASDGGVFIDGTDRYYRIAEAGFNYVDDQCQAYFDSIFFIDRERSQFKSGLAAASATTAAILGVTGASTLSLSVVASAFGFASAATDILAGTYLYSLPPSTTQGLVNRLQTTYRAQAAKFRAEIDSPTAAYHQIQGYLALCLPPRIESEVIRTVNAAGTELTPGSSGSAFSVQSTGASTTTRPEPAKVVRVVEIRSPTMPLGNAASGGKPPPNNLGVNSVEQSLLPITVKNWQIALCVTDADNKPVRDGRLGGKLGDIRSPTRSAIRQFLLSESVIRTDISPNSDDSYILGKREVDILNNELTPDEAKCKNNQQ
jgi:hypothetical protein